MNDVATLRTRKATDALIEVLDQQSFGALEVESMDEMAWQMAGTLAGLPEVPDKATRICVIGILSRRNDDPWAGF